MAACYELIGDVHCGLKTPPIITLRTQSKSTIFDIFGAWNPEEIDTSDCAFVHHTCKMQLLYLEKFQKPFFSNSLSWAFWAATEQVFRAWNWVYFSLFTAALPNNWHNDLVYAPFASKQYSISASWVGNLLRYWLHASTVWWMMWLDCC